MIRNKPRGATVYGVDLGKNIFHVVGTDPAGNIIQRVKFRRDTLLAFFERAEPALVGMEACPGAQWLARKLQAIGHSVRIIPAHFVKPYVKSNKNDIIDAAAIAEAVVRPTMRFVEIKRPDQVDSHRKLWQKTVLMHEPLFENDARGSHHGLAATAVHSREAGYIYATVIVVRPRTLHGRGGPYIFCRDFLHHLDLEVTLGHQLLQLGVLILERLQPLGVRHFEAAVLGLPFVERRAADPVRAAHIGRLHPASCSRKIPMICSSVNRLGFMSIPSEVMDSTHSRRRSGGSGHSEHKGGTVD